MEVAGKIIYKWAIYTMAMLNNQRVYTSISQASFINQPAESLLWCTPPLAAFVAFAFDWLSSGDVALGKGSMGRNLWFKETSGEFARFIFNMIDHIYIKTWFISWFWYFSNARSVFKKVSIPMYVPKLLVVDEKTMLICAHWGVFLF